MMFQPLKKYAVFKGRARRKEYWLFFLFSLIIVGATRLFINEILAGLIGLILFLPSLAVGVRRFHDLDKSGWFILLGFIPIVGNIIVLVFSCFDGTAGDNRFGEDPKADERIVKE